MKNALLKVMRTKVIISSTCSSSVNFQEILTLESWFVPVTQGHVSTMLHTVL